MSIKGDISISGNRPPLKEPVLVGSPVTYLRMFQVLIDAAVAGDRCPMLQQMVDIHKIPGGYAVNRLVDLGWIKSEIYMHNWRVVEIMVGEHKGARTQEHPDKRRPYKTFFNSNIQL